MPTTTQGNSTTSLEALRLLTAPGSYVELRAIPVDKSKARTITKVSKDPERIAAKAAEIEAAGEHHIYITANPMDRPPANDAARDSDISQRRWLIIDLDPERPSGTAATDSQHQAALARAEGVRAWLVGRGWPEPVVIDSGNGAYVLARIDLPADPASRTLVGRCLAALAEEFDDDEVHVDPTVVNASRIIRLPGTTNRKGGGTRVAVVVSALTVNVPASRELLEALADEAPEGESSYEGGGLCAWCAFADKADMDAHTANTLNALATDLTFDAVAGAWDNAIVHPARRLAEFVVEPTSYLTEADALDELKSWTPTLAGYTPEQTVAEVTKKLRRAITRARGLHQQHQREHVADAEDQREAPKPKRPPDLEAFWGRSELLTELATYARARMVSPWAVLGGVLAGVAARVGPHVILPPVVGHRGSLNLLVAMVGKPGAGKDAAQEAAAEYLGTEYRLTTRKVGTGQGICATYIRAKKNHKPVQVRDTALFTLEEIDTLAAHASMAGANIMPTLKDAFMGARLGEAYADDAKYRPIDKHFYRLAVIAGIQPTKAGVLLKDEGGGMPQRWLWLPARDKHRPKVRPEAPLVMPWLIHNEALSPQWEADEPEEPGDQPIGLRRPDEIVLPVCSAARAEMEAQRAKEQDEDPTALPPHYLYRQFKVAALLAILHGREAVEDWEWETAAIVAQVSDTTQKECEQAVELQRSEETYTRALAKAQESDVLAEHAAEIASTSRSIVNRLKKAAKNGSNDGYVKHRDLKDALGRNKKYIRPAVAALINAGTVEVKESSVKNGETAREYRLVSNTGAES